MLQEWGLASGTPWSNVVKVFSILASCRAGFMDVSLYEAVPKGEAPQLGVVLHCCHINTLKFK